MTLISLLETLGQIGIREKLINYSAAGGSMYELNDTVVKDYPMLYISPTGNHRVGENFTTYSLTIFYLDRLLEDNSNAVDIHSTGIEALKNLIRKASMEDEVLDTSDEYTITLFTETERMKDRVNGCYATIDITVANGTTCPAESYTFTLLTPPTNALASGDTGIYAAWKTDIPQLFLELLDYNMERIIFTGGTGLTEFSYSVPPNTDTGATRTYTLRIIGPSNIPTDLRATVTYTQAAAEPEPAPTGDTGEYLTFEILSSGTIQWVALVGNDEGHEIQYSMDGGETWESMRSYDAIDPPFIEAEAGDTILLKGYNDSYSGSTFSGSTAVFDIRGNFMSLINGDDFANLKSFPEGSSHNFHRLLEGTNVHTAQWALLPATTHMPYCYDSMFKGCRSLTYGPAMAYDVDFADHSCSWMFISCHNLGGIGMASNVLGGKAAPYCCEQMFRFTSVEEFDLQTYATATACFELMFADSAMERATIRNGYLTDYSCRSMFKNCASFNNLTCFATALGTDATADWLDGVAANGTFTKAASMEDWTTGTSGIPEGWTVEDYE